MAILTKTPEQELTEALDPLALAEFTALYAVPYRPKPSPLWLEVRCLVLATIDTLAATTSAAVRKGLYASAEEIIATVERLGWHHARAPRIEFDARISDGKMVGHTCEVRLEITRPSQVTPSA